MTLLIFSKKFKHLLCFTSEKVILFTFPTHSKNKNQSGGTIGGGAGGGLKIFEVSIVYAIKTIIRHTTPPSIYRIRVV